MRWQAQHIAPPLRLLGWSWCARDAGQTILHAADGASANAGVRPAGLWQGLLTMPPCAAHLRHGAVLLQPQNQPVQFIDQRFIGPDAPRQPKINCRQWFQEQ